MLGVREPDIYGFKNLTAIAQECEEYAEELNCDVEFKQSNHEGELVTLIQEARDNFSGVIINAGGYTHTSVALHDALKTLDAPVIEVHLSNPLQREAFRHTSLVAPVAKGTIAGFGGHSYILALDAMCALLNKDQ